MPCLRTSRATPWNTESKFMLSIGPPGDTTSPPHKLDCIDVEIFFFLFFQVIPAALEAIKDAEYEGTYIRPVSISQLIIKDPLLNFANLRFFFGHA